MGNSVDVGGGCLVNYISMTQAEIYGQCYAHIRRRYPQMADSQLDWNGTAGSPKRPEPKTVEVEKCKHAYMFYGTREICVHCGTEPPSEPA